MTSFALLLWKCTLLQMLLLMCVPSGFIGLSSAPSSWTLKHLQPRVWQKADLCAALFCPFPECNVQLIRESLEQTLLARPPAARPLCCFHGKEEAGEDQMQYFSRTTGGTTCQPVGEVTEDLQGLLSVCCLWYPSGTWI